jgi:adenine-specific DNA-methyltransferase
MVVVPVRETRAQGRYNFQNCSVPMSSDSFSLDLETLETSLEETLFAQLRLEASAHEFKMRPAQLRTLGRRLLGSTLPKRVGSTRGRAPETGFGSIREDEFEPRDYLHLVPQEIRRSLGQYMTPKPIARYILQAARYRDDEGILDRTLCDPACGSGIFLVEAIRAYLRALHGTGVPVKDWYTAVQTHFVGIDVDPIACLYARFNLSLLLVPALLHWMRARPECLPEPLPIYQRDTLGSLASELGEGRLWGSQDSAPSLAGAFDLVVGNPPYRKLGRMPSELRQAFAASIYGHPNAYGMFLHAGIEMLRPGGRLGFIVPRSMLSGLYFQNLRRMIEEETCLEEISLFSDRKRVFSQVLQGTMVLVFRKRRTESGGGAEASPIRTAVIRSVSELDHGGPAHVLAGTAQVVRRLNGTTVWFVSDRERTYSLLDRVVGRHPLLTGPAVGCPARTGPIVWNRVKPYLRPKGGKGTLPLVWATDVGRFRFDFGTAGDSRPAFLAETSETGRLATSGPSILVQRVTADEQARRIVASLAAFPACRRYFVENHLNLLQPATVGTVDLRFLLGILSSDVVEFLFRTMNGNTQVSATELNLLPVPRGRFEPEIAEIVTVLEEVAPNERDDLDQELNERVARAYGISGAELRFLQKGLRENPAVGEPRRDT